MRTVPLCERCGELPVMLTIEPFGSEDEDGMYRLCERCVMTAVLVLHAVDLDMPAREVKRLSGVA